MILNTKKIQIIRARTGLNTKELAQRYGCSLSRFNAVMAKKNVRPETVGKLAAALGVDVLDIIEEEE
jgi:transcriptional regulator with XRE-family HTH domain